MASPLEAPALGTFQADAYADRTIETTIDGKVVFAKVNRSKVADIQDMINEIGRNIGEITNVPQVAAPRRGVLKQPLTTQGRKQLNAFLGPAYAERVLQDQENMKDIPIEERGDGMTSVEEALKRYNAQYQLYEKPYEEYCGQYASQQRIFYLRTSVADKIANACKALNSVGLQTRIYDCFRPEAVQAPLFIRRVITIAQREPTWEFEKVLESAKSLTAFSPGMAGHQAGAAVDWRLKRIDKSGWRPQLGNTYPEGGAVSSIDFPYVTFDEWKTRVLFEGTAMMSGLRLLRSEDWHSSHGDRGMGLDGEKHNAFYGPIKSFDEESGEITQWYDKQEIDQSYLSDEEIWYAIHMARSKEFRSVRSAFDKVVNSLPIMRQSDSARANQARSWNPTQSHAK